MANVEVSEKLTRQVAELARLELSDAEVHLFTQQLGAVLKHVEQLQAVDVEGVEPLVHPMADPLELATLMREDVVRLWPTDAEGASRVLECAPETLHGGFKVPPIL